MHILMTGQLGHNVMQPTMLIFAPPALGLGALTGSPGFAMVDRGLDLTSISTTLPCRSPGFRQMCLIVPNIPIVVRRQMVDFTFYMLSTAPPLLI